MWVVKIGGSLAFAPELAGWLQQLAVSGAGRVVVVPGGGLFADQVRMTQNQLRFPDTLAHRMALRAMDQYGLMLCGIEPRLVPVVTEEAVDAALAAHQVPVWLPTCMLDERQDIEMSWDVSADSIAAWFASHRGYRRLLLVKSVVLGTESVSQQDLINRDILDRAFPRFRQEASEVRCVNRTAYRWLPRLLAGTMALGALVSEA